jgi:predicted fused transcriptional regulator/phosphomethylpyrimidine kinase/predicted transcriptional regulator
MLAAALAKRGFPQREIADRLGVSQAAVSQYLSGESNGEERFAEHPRMQETVERIAQGFATGEMDDYEALAELLELVRAFEDRGPICAVHEAEMPALDGMGCDLCVRGRDRGVQRERDVLSNVRRAVRRFENAPGVAAHVPNVGTNVVMALPDATDETDVAAVPGRLHAMRGGINVPSDPEFGASHHVATMVLTASAAESSIRGAVNLATSDALLDAVPATLDTLTFDAAYENRKPRLRDLFQEGVPRVVYHEGAFGIEPITYVLDESAVAAVETAVELVGRAGGN